MTEEHPHSASSKRRAPPPVVAYYGAAAVLLIGLVTAAFVYVFAIGDSDVDAAAEVASERMYQHNLEVMGGKFAVYLDEFDRWFASLWHGKTLAYTIVVLAIAIAVVCIRVGDLISRRHDDT